ncbi:L-arabinose-binding protein [Hydrogenispora ethanolica]|uniref:L-arabinose-binding protein n=1 Tax=Hydrogenispora ethanolica TaxID=1082276 RepID=A0A4R1SB58_HYDET|nr:ABC transporter substrate-binding protein [Hydrogenispora ethanolica]TCL76773.1 L-arabinose-binding protein [Hydrogenispora ethanolica]
MRRITAWLLILIVALAMAFPGYAAPKATTLTFWTFQELHKGFWDDAVATWNKAHPAQPIALKTEVYNYDEMHNKLLVALQSGVGAPDLADIEISKFANYLKGKTPQLVSLNSIVKPVLSKCIKARFDNYAKNGQYYGVDYHVGATVMYYNKEYLDKAGVDANKILTWDDYVAAGKKVVAATGKPMTTVEVTEQWTFYPLLSQYGSDIFAKNGKVILDSPANVKVLTFLKDMIYKDKIAIPAPGGYHHSEEYWAFMNKGGAASLMMPMWYMGRFVQYMPDLKGKMIIRPLPAWKKGGNRSAGMGGTGTVITAQSKNKALALKLMAAAKLSKEGAIKTWTLLGFDPIRWDVWSDPAMKADNQYTNYFGKDIFNMLTDIKDEIGPTVITEKYPLAIDLIKKNVSFKALKEQSATPEQVLKEVADELRK